MQIPPRIWEANRKLRTACPYIYPARIVYIHVLILRRRILACFAISRRVGARPAAVRQSIRRQFILIEVSGPLRLLLLPTPSATFPARRRANLRHCCLDAGTSSRRDSIRSSLVATDVQVVFYPSLIRNYTAAYCVIIIISNSSIIIIIIIIIMDLYSAYYKRELKC